jgi:cysteine-rich repeat protein
MQEHLETCDDGNADGGDGCDEQCAPEPGWRCPAAGAPCLLAVRCGGIDCPMRLVPAGEFVMGCDADAGPECLGDASPPRRVHLAAFFVDVDEVTLAQFERCVAAGTCAAPRDAGAGCNRGVAGREDHPVNCVDWEQARAYCAWAGKALPTEAQWEKAARGTGGRAYPWGDETADCEHAAMIGEAGDGCGRGSTWPAGSWPARASPYGARDLAGNVAEWTADWYDSQYYLVAPAMDPRGPDGGSERVVRGGDWRSAAAALRASARDRAAPERADDRIGVRCAMAAREERQ